MTTLFRRNRWAPRDQQSHRAGPVIFGQVPLGNGRAINDQAAYLVGTIFGQHGDMFSMRVQYTY